MMSLTESTMLELQSQAPDFTLPDATTGKKISLIDVQTDNGLLVVFMCNHCPYVVHVLPEILRIAAECKKKNIGFVAINSNDVEKYPDDSPEKMKELAANHHFPFPYLYDETQEVARVYDAACTPDFYLFDGKQELYYRGRLDGSRPSNSIPLTGEDLRKAIISLENKIASPPNQYPSAGCNIKWKK